MQTPEKISLKLQLDQDIRRITVVSPFAFAELQTKIKALFRFEAEKTFTIKYTDDEGDLCTVSSDEELNEAVRFSQPTLRLQISVSQPKPKPTRSCPAWPRASCGSPRRCGPMGQKIRNSTDLASQAIEMMETDVTKAKALFFQQLEACPPWHTANCLYNIACCESVLGNIDSALSFLSRSIDAGYRNATHMNSDTDFANIKHTDGFKELLASISERSEQQPKPQESAPGPDQLYNLACYHSLMGNLEPAINSLGKAVEAGFFKFNQLLNNPDLFPLHSIPNWNQFVNQVQQQQPKQPEPVPQPQKVEVAPVEAPAVVPLAKITPVKVVFSERLAVRRDISVATSAPEAIPLTQIRKVEIPAPHVIPLTQIRKVELPAPQVIPLTQIRRVTPPTVPTVVEAPVVEAPTAPVVQQPQISHPDISQTSLDVLFEMGFLDRPRNLAALLVCGGNVEQAIARLLN